MPELAVLREVWRFVVKSRECESRHELPLLDDGTSLSRSNSAVPKPVWLVPDQLPLVYSPEELPGVVFCRLPFGRLRLGQGQGGNDTGGNQGFSSRNPEAEG